MKIRKLILSVPLVLFLVMTVFTEANAQNISDFSPTTTTAGTGSQITINGTGFGSGPASANKYVEFPNADNGGLTSVLPALVEYVSWTDNQIVVIVPSGAGTGFIKVYNGTRLITSSGKLKVSYNIFNISTDQIKHINANTEGGYTWQLELSFNAQSNAKNSFLKSLSTWACFSGVSWKVGAPTPANQTGRDGINIVRFDTPESQLPAGVLGVAYTFYTSCGSNNWQLVETDLVFDKEQSWNFEDALPAPSKFDFQTVVQHELGHALSLGHVIDNADLMNFSIGPGSRTTIGINNRNGADFQVAFSVLPAGGGSCSAQMIATIPTTCAYPYPKITGFSPQKAGIGKTIRITGEHLNTTASVSFGDTPAASFTIISDTQLDAVLAAGSSGEVAVNTAGGISVLNGFTFLPPPVINSFSPEFGFTGDTITLVGANLSTTTLINFGGISVASFIVKNDETVKAVLAAGASGKISLSTESGSVEVPGFIFSARPIISSFTSSGKRGDVIVINGNNFNQIQSVRFGGLDAASFVVDSEIKISAVLAFGSSGSVSITASYGSATKPGFVFFPEPTLSSVSPLFAAQGATVKIVGTNLSGATEVLFGGKAPSSFVVVSATEISVIMGKTASGQVTVRTPGGTAVADGFTFIPTLTIDSFSPKIASTDQKVIINGSNFIKVIELSFGGTPAKSFLVNSESMITATVALGSSGDIKVRTADGLISIPGFTYVLVPRVDFFIPTAVGAGRMVTITGTNFDQITSVKFGGIEAAAFKVLSASTIQAQPAAGASGAVTVANPGGYGELQGFSFIPVPTITSVNPLLGAKDAEINIYGTNFLSTQTVSIGGKLVSSFKVISATQITAYVADAAQDGKIQVSTLGGDTSFDGFRFILPPQINTYLPREAISGVSVLISGANFADVTAVSFGGKAASSFTILSSTSISAVVAPGSASGNLVLNSPGGQSIMEGFTFIFTLPTSNFSISSTGLTCKGASNGIISVKAEQILNYTLTISGNNQNSRYDFSNLIDLKNLSAGVYQVCFTINSESTFKQCFEIIVAEPKDLSLFSFVNKQENTLNLKLDGSDIYFVELNGQLIKTPRNELSLSLKSGLNKVKVYTDKLCQGFIERTFFMDAVQIYPNPFETKLNLILGSEYFGPLKINIRSIGGMLMFSGNYQLNENTLTLDIEPLPTGTYLLEILSSKTQSVHKILRH